MAEVVPDAAPEGAVADALVGTVVNGRFHIVKRIARGGMANVYFATQAPLSRPVAVKVLHGVRNVEAESEESFRARFLREASMLAKLQHPNIVMLLDYGQIVDVPGEHYFMAMEYLRGETLAQRFRVRGRLNIEECIALARQIGRALREAHRHGFIHRDLKPSNIMLVPEDDSNDIVKLVDFGVGKIVADRAGVLEGEDEDVTRAGILLGSPRYMSPEQIRCEPVELRTDLYALGVILFQALTGRLPFDARTEFDVMMAHCLTPAPLLHEVSPDQPYPASLSLLVEALLQKQVTRRPTIDEYLQRLALVEEEVFGSVSLAGPTLQAADLGPISRRERLSLPDSARDFRSVPTWSQRVETANGVQTSQSVQTASMPPLSAPPLATSVAQGSSNAKGPWRRALLAVGLLGLAGLGVLLLSSLGEEETRVLASSALTSGTRSATPVSAVPAAVEPTPAPEPPGGSFQLTIDSEPPKAIVTENGIIIGITPVTTTIERRSVAVEPRRFLVKHEGYYPYTLEQFDSDSAVRASVLLEAHSAAASERPRAARKPAARSAAKEDATIKRSGLDIRLRR